MANTTTRAARIAAQTFFRQQSAGKDTTGGQTQYLARQMLNIYRSEKERLLKEKTVMDVYRVLKEKTV
tara:strand:+ start:172 stop:375 length:204 start_codon:yes stop_codon:yes gene_type:complete